MQRDPGDSLVSVILAGATAGAYRLPDAIGKAQAADTALSGRLLDARRQIDELAIGNLAAQISNEVGETGTYSAELSKALDKARNRRLSLEHEADVLDMAASDARHNFFGAISSTSDELLDDLRAALDEVRDEARQIGPSFDGLDPDNAQSLLGNTAALAALRRLIELETRYDAIRNSWRALMLRFGGMTVGEVESEHAEVRNVVDLRGPERWLAHRQLPPLAPAGGLKRFIWLMTTAEPWLPTPSELNEHTAAIRERFGVKSRESAYGAMVAE